MHHSEAFNVIASVHPVWRKDAAELVNFTAPVSKDLQESASFDVLPKRTLDAETRSRIIAGVCRNNNLRISFSINPTMTSLEVGPEKTWTRSARILLEPMVEIPAREKWLFENPDALESVRRGLSGSLMF